MWNEFIADSQTIRWDLDKLKYISSLHSVSLVLKFFFESSTIFLFLNSDSPGSRFTKELMGVHDVFSLKLILGSSGMVGILTNWLENFILGSCKLTGTVAGLKISKELSTY